LLLRISVPGVGARSFRIGLSFALGEPQNHTIDRSQTLSNN
jgi:hypothetical protein